VGQLAAGWQLCMAASQMSKNSAINENRKLEMAAKKVSTSKAAKKERKYRKRNGALSGKIMAKAKMADSEYNGEMHIRKWRNNISVAQ